MPLPAAPIINASGEGRTAQGGDRVPKAVRGQQRWRPGKAPEWADGAGGGAGGGEGGQARPARRVEDPAVIGPGVVTHDATDRRLRRLAAGGGARRRDVAEAEILEGGAEGDSDGETTARRRRARRADSDEDEDGDAHADVAEQQAAADEDSDDEEALEARRARVRQLALARRAQEEEGAQEGMPLEDEDEEKAGDGSSEDSWEYETDSEEEDQSKLIKPVFVSKQQRATLDERARIEREEEEEIRMQAARKEERKKETRKLVAEELLKEQQMQADRTMRMQREDTDDEANEEEEYDKWRLRELKRIKRDREARVRLEREKADTLQRRGMSDKEVMEENARLGRGQKGERAKMGFMQKYHHKGAYFMENDESGKFKEEIYNRDTNQATAADLATARLAQNGPHDKSRVLQVRTGKLAKMGQTKWTHLTAEDTSKDSPWALGDDTIRRKMQKRLGGFG